MRKLIAIIDDEIVMKDLYNFILERPIRRGLLEIKFFSDSREFVEWFKKNTPDLILTDINLPHMDGTLLMDIVKKSGRNIPTYFVSGYHESNYKNSMRDLSVNRFISKPLNFNHVLDLIELDLGILPSNL